MDTNISEFHIDAYDEVYSFWQLNEGVGLGEADSKENIQRHLNHNPGLSFVARNENGELIGTAFCSHDGRRAYLHHVAVHPRCRRQGIGSALVNKCFESLKSIGIPKCHALIFTENHAGRRFWKNIGWVEREGVMLISKTIEQVD
jgi:putative acetyltransferase